MSGEADTFFNIYYDGKFKTHRNNGVTYDGGNYHLLESPAHALFEGIMDALNMSLYDQRIWYKLSYEDLKDLKLLCEGVDNFQNMCNTANWTKTVDIYMEKDEDENDENEGVENDNVRNETGNIVEEEAPISEFEEAARVENMVDGFVDEEDNEEYRDTPPASDGEEEQNGSYERWMRGSGELKIKQVFESVNEFKEAVLEYALKGGWNIQFSRWGLVKSEAKCGVKAKEDGHCKILSDTIIANLFINDVRNDPLLKPKFIQAQIEERYNLVASNDQCRKAKKKALDLIQAEYDEQYSRIKDYEIEILESNPSSSTELRTAIGDAGLERFDRFYVCFSALRHTWKTYCRPIFGIDGCFIKSSLKGQLLAAVGRDSNNQVYPIAWAVVNVENTDTWTWFIQKLKADLDLGNGNGFTVISDKQKGLIKAVEEELPQVEHRMCARHIYGNLKKVFPKKARMKSLFWRVVESHNMADYKESMAELKTYDSDVYEAFMKRNPECCSRAFFKTTSSCEDALNNFSESYNSSIDKARSLPLVEMLETMRRQAMIRIDVRKKKIMKHKGKFTPKVGKIIDMEEKERKWCRAYPGPTGLFEVRERGVSYKVNMRMKTCSCRRWDLTGIPCRHSLCVVLEKKSYKTEDLVARWYLTSTWQNQYNDSIRPLNGMKFWKASNKVKLKLRLEIYQKAERRIRQNE